MAFYTPFAEGDPATPSTFNDRFDETGVSLNARGISPMERAANGDGINDDRAVLAAIDALDDALLLPAAKTFLVASDLTLSGKVIGRGGLIKPASGVTVTISGGFEAGLLPCFDISEGGSIVFEGLAPATVHTCWWNGYAADGITDNTAAIQAAIDSLATVECGVVELDMVGGLSSTVTDTLCRFEGTISLRRGVTVQGPSSGTRQVSGIIPFYVMHDPDVADTDAFDIPQDSHVDRVTGVILRDLTIRSGNASSRAGIAIDDGLADSLFENLFIRDFVDGVRASSTINVKFRQCRIRSCTNDVRFYANGEIATTTTFEKCYLTEATAWPILAEADSILNLACHDTIFESSVEGAMNLHKGSTATLVNCYTENVPSSDATAKSIFRVGIDGTSAFAANQRSALFVIGGRYTGTNTTWHDLSSFIDADDAYQITVLGAYIARVGKIIRTTATTGNTTFLGNRIASTTTGGGAQPWGDFSDLSRFVGTQPILQAEHDAMFRANSIAANNDLFVAGDLGFYGGAAVAKPTGVAVTAAAIHAALVTLNLIAP